MNGEGNISFSYFQKKREWKKKKSDVCVYGDVNIDIVIPGVEKFPEPGQEDEVPVMETLPWEEAPHYLLLASESWVCIRSLGGSGR